MKFRSFSFWLCAVLALVLGLGIRPAVATPADPNPIVGTWEGTLDPGAQPKKRVVVHITASQEGTLSGTIEFPDQNVSGVIMTAVTYKAGTLHFESNSGFYDGTMNKNSSELAGTWKSVGAPLSLNLKRTAHE